MVTDDTHAPRGGAKPRCEQCGGPVAGTAVVNGATFTGKALQYVDKGGLAIFEGDIVLGTVEEVTGALDSKSVGRTGKQFRWPGATVPYEIAAAMPDTQRVTDAIAHWTAHTPIRFVPRTAQHHDYVTFRGGEGCSSTVGRKGGQQFVTLGPDCTAGNAIHEIGHTVGLWHEQGREDRKHFVTIVWTNILVEDQSNFVRHVSDGDDRGPYDYGSIMHYPLNAFAIDEQQDTMIPLKPVPAGVTIGQRVALSAGDIAGIKAMYPPAPKDAPQDTTKGTTKDKPEDTPDTAPAAGPGAPAAGASVDGVPDALALAAAAIDELADARSELEAQLALLAADHEAAVERYAALKAGDASA